MTDEWKEPAEVSTLIKIPVATLAQWRYRQIGPPYVRIGRHVRYPASGLQAWLDSQPRGGDAA
ncbi:MAG: helix-turn-helix domain-containing protein [Actinobacteria bacterium]|nr:helix-turn-helix domain-containing protein [Actinomycetota bacterium]